LKPDNANAYLVLANAHLQTRKYAEVIKDFDEYLKLQPNALGSADIRERRDRLQRALEEAQSKTSADPN
jgi:Tetratricopeptide repeat.